MTTITELPAEKLFRRCQPESLGFQTTDELPDLEDVIGQPRAIRALELGSHVKSLGYNIFVVGLPDSGRTTLSREYLERLAAEPRPGYPEAPDDWCYVHNFDDPHIPKALRLPAGRGAELRRDVQELLRRCLEELPRQFDSDAYQQEREKVIGVLKAAQDEAFGQLQQEVARQNFVVVRTSTGMAVLPAHGDQPYSQEDFEKLTNEQRAQLQAIQGQLTDQVEKVFERMRGLESQTGEALVKLGAQMAEFMLTPMFEELGGRYQGLESVLAYLQAIKQDMVDLFQHYNPSAESESDDDDETPDLSDILESRCQVNLLVDNSERKGAPVIIESYPSYSNLVGRIEQEYVMGAMRTHYTMIRPGALHRANGGYLIIPARDLFISPFAWDGLKRSLRDGCIRIMDLPGGSGPTAAVASLEPEPIPLDVKIVMIGTPAMYEVLRGNDEDFAKLFKVRAEFAIEMDRTPATEREYGLYIKSVVLNNHLIPFDSSAVARIIEHSARMAEHQNKLSTRFGHIADLACEAAFWAGKSGRVLPDGRSIVLAEDVQRAISESSYRNNLYEEHLQELLTDGTLLLSLSGKRVGQVNGLSVLDLGDYAFGRPSRMTAVVFPGREGVVDIERQADMAGALHTKGVLILTGFLSGRYMQSGPLSVTASLTFEQSYSGVEGDSASAAEAYAIMSAITQAPIRQDRAITGSISQHGEIQTIGGVNEKIEGFFLACKTAGLTSEQGVIIPSSNVQHLMLNPEVIEAVREGKFHIWPISTFDEGIPLLMDMEAGEIQPDGAYPPGTFNHLVQERLEHFAGLGRQKDAD